MARRVRRGVREAGNCCSRPARTPSSCSPSTEAGRFGRGQDPVPLCTGHRGHNFKEVIDYRGPRVPEDGVQWWSRRSRDSIDAGARVPRRGPAVRRGPAGTGCRPHLAPNGDRGEPGFDAVFGGGRPGRGEGTGAKETGVLLPGTEFRPVGIPKNQRPELWSIYNPPDPQGEHIRVSPPRLFQLEPRWTSCQYIAGRSLEIPVHLLRPSARWSRREASCFEEKRVTPGGEYETVFETTSGLPARSRQWTCPGRGNPTATERFGT